MTDGAANGTANGRGGAPGGGGGMGAHGSGVVEMIELEPQYGAPLLRDAHLDLLRQLLGAEAMESGEAEATQHEQPWAVYVERMSGAGVGSAATPGDPALDMSDGSVDAQPGACGSGAEEANGWHASAEIFSLDAPMLLSFAADHEAEAGMLRAAADAFDEEDLVDDDRYLKPSRSVGEADGPGDEDDEDRFEAMALNDSGDVVTH